MFYQKIWVWSLGPVSRLARGLPLPPSSTRSLSRELRGRGPPGCPHVLQGLGQGQRGEVPHHGAGPFHTCLDLVAKAGSAVKQLAKAGGGHSPWRWQSQGLSGCAGTGRWPPGAASSRMSRSGQLKHLTCFSSNSSHGCELCCGPVIVCVP